ncbi:glycosyl hydrolase family 28-related protein [Chitinophaga sp.]|uniref:glycosyl hydrolase family 28-related protein n=1 Tax=Chitinophaga sp. TaxID=1869181 RepID=UPI002F928C79
MKFNSMVDLRADATVFNPNDLIHLLGYYSPGDGGGGDFYWDAASTENDNGGSIIKRTSVATGRFKAILNDVINVKRFGARGTIDDDDTLAIANALAACVAMNILTLYIPQGEYVTTQNIVLTQNHQILKGESRGGSIIKLKSGARVGTGNTQYAQLLSFKIDAVEGEGCVNGLLVDSSPLTLVEDVYVTGYYTECGIRVGANSYSTRFVRCFTNNIYTGDGWWLRNEGNNSIQLQSCYALNTKTGCGISISQANNVVIDAPQLEANKEGHIQFYAATNVPGAIRSLVINDLYAEQSCSPNKPTFTIKHESGVMNIRGLYVNGGYVNGFSMPYFADFSGIISGSGTAGISCHNVNIQNITTAGYNIDASVRGYITGPAPLTDLTDCCPLVVTLPGNAGNVAVVRNRSIGIAESMQPLLLGPYNPILAQAGALWYDATQDNLRFKDAKGDYILGARSLYIPPVIGTLPDLSKIKQDYFIPLNATNAAITIPLPAASSVPAGLTITIKKIDASANPVTITSASLMDGAGSRTLSAQYETLTVMSDGSSIYRVVSAVNANSNVFSNTSIAKTAITNTYLNTNYPAATYPAGTLVVFTNLSDAAANTAECRRLSATAWSVNATAAKL